MTDIQAAAERVLSAAFEPSLGYTREHYTVGKGFVEAAQLLARTVQREGDGEAVTEEWIDANTVLSIDGQSRHLAAGLAITMNQSGRAATVWTYCEQCKYSGVLIGRFKTIGQLRTLARGLGIQLQEQPNAQ